MTTKKAIVASVRTRESALAEIQQVKAQLSPRVRNDVKRATKKLIDRYEHDIRELAKR